jgi:hypothetical protein
LQAGGGAGTDSGRRFDVFFEDIDVCNLSDDDSSTSSYEETYGSCDTSKFPVCQDDELICYNRRPSRTRFYPNSWDGCSSCSPGRYCFSEKRCILDDKDYPCSKWF